jgi:hypothetical protein
MNDILSDYSQAAPVVSFSETDKDALIAKRNNHQGDAKKELIYSWNYLAPSVMAILASGAYMWAMNDDRSFPFAVAGMFGLFFASKHYSEYKVYRREAVVADIDLYQQNGRNISECRNKEAVQKWAAQNKLSL